jgi:uncharacterized protein (DUF2141 family)
MSRHCWYSSSVIVLAILFGSPAPAQEEFVGKQLMQCAIDIPVHCSSARPGGGRIVKCLQEKRTEITSECRDAVTPTDFADGSEGLRIEVTIDKLKSREGSVIILLNDDPEKFPAPAKRTMIMPIGTETRTVHGTFRHLKAGTYALGVVHDLDDNGKLDAGEGFAASNDVAGPPNFSASAIKVDKNASVAISMRYP